MKHMFPHSDFHVEGEPKDIGAAKELAKNRYQFQWWALSLIGARPVGSKPDNPREGKKGADEGVDGWLRFRLGEEIESIVVQVKSGHVSVKDIRELRDVVSRQGAEMGIFLTLENPTGEMVKEMKVTEPYIIKSMNQEYPKIQILTIEQLLHGIKPNMPSTASAFQQAILAKKVSTKNSSTLDDYPKK
jgi:site-specific DNA-methyltransferase (adenine-specific)